jgi:hypothetical protein
MARGQLARGGVGSAVAHPTLHVVSTRLSHAGSGNVLVALVDGVLHLLQELINVDQIVLGADVRHWRKMVRGRMTTARAVATTTGDRNSSRHRLILGNRAIQNWKLKGLETEQALADSRIGVGIELASLQVTEELVQSIVPTLAVVRLGTIMTLAQRIVDIAIRMGVGGGRRRVCLVVLGSSMSVGGARNAVHRSLKVMRGSSVSFGVLGKHHIRVVVVMVMLESRLWGSDLRVIGMGLDVLLQVLRALEGLATEVALVWLQGDMDANMGGDVIALDGGGVAVAPLAGQVQVVGALATDMALADVFVERFS